MAARERYVWYGSEKRSHNVAVRKRHKIPTCMFSWCFRDTTKLELAVSQERRESGPIYDLRCTKYLTRKFVKGDLEHGREET